jgi:hypothetical protein
MIDPTAVLNVGEQHMLFGDTRGAEQLWSEVDQIVTSLYLAIRVNTESYEEAIGAQAGKSQSHRARCILRAMKLVHFYNTSTRINALRLDYLGLFIAEYPAPYTSDFWWLLQILYSFSQEVPLFRRRTELLACDLEHFPGAYLKYYLRGEQDCQKVWDSTAEYILVSELVKWLAANWLRKPVSIQYQPPLRESALSLIGLHGITHAPKGVPVTIALSSCRPPSVSQGKGDRYWVTIPKCEGLNTDNQWRHLKTLVRVQGRLQSSASLFLLKPSKREEGDRAFNAMEEYCDRFHSVQ